LAAENWSINELLQAGWSETDLAWEAAAERAVQAVAQSDHLKAKTEAGQALQLARAAFEPIDPRLGTSLANYGLCLGLTGDGAGPKPLLRDALAVWRAAGPWIARMDAPRMARSSMFHLRMELRHRDTYRARWRERWHEMTEEARRRIEAPAPSPDAIGASAEGAAARWRRERPAMLNDTRKLMAAAFLLLAPPVSKRGHDQGTA
jgi:hypothetical protein